MMKTKADMIIAGMLAKKIPSEFWGMSEHVSAIGGYEFNELCIARSFVQRNDRTVYQHTMQVLDGLENKNRTTLWAALFHDLGKIKTRTIDADNEVHFYGHEMASVAIARMRLTEFGEDPSIVAEVSNIIETHMLDLRGHVTKRVIRNFIATVGKNNVINWFTVRNADALSYSKDDNYVDIIITPFRDLVQKELDAMPQDVKMKHPRARGDGLRITGGNTDEK